MIVGKCWRCCIFVDHVQPPLKYVKVSRHWRQSCSPMCLNNCFDCIAVPCQQWLYIAIAGHSMPFHSPSPMQIKEPPSPHRSKQCDPHAVLFMKHMKHAIRPTERYWKSVTCRSPVSHLWSPCNTSGPGVSCGAGWRFQPLSSSLTSSSLQTTHSQ